MATDFNYEGWSTRAQLVYKRTYARPINEKENIFEDWDETIDRVIDHQKWLWERAKGAELNQEQNRELAKLKMLILERKVSVSGRTLWMGGTNISKTREVSQFNCAALEVRTVYDVVDALWLLLNGVGVGFKPVVGCLTGFNKPIKDVQVIRSQKQIGEKGNPENVETWDAEKKVWVIKVGDSSEAWAKSIGKILAGQYPARKLVLDFSEVRAAGSRLSNYGWISSGDNNISKAFFNIVEILNKKSGSLLTKIDIMDVMNWLGTSLSSRRSAQICFVDYNSNEWMDFAVAKKNYWLTGNPQRAQSNNSLMFRNKPSRAELENIFNLMSETGGAEPGIINVCEAERRAPWFTAGNPCFEILLSHAGFCNLCEINLAQFRNNTAGLHEAARLIARANYRQTCVNLQDGILQEVWHLNNQFLRLCGVGLTGIAQRPDMIDYDYRQLERIVTNAAYSMADELDMPRPKNVSCVKPSGSLSKVYDCTEGLHKPLGKYIFNNIVFAKADPLVDKLKKANYNVFDHPNQEGEVLVTFPTSFEDVEFNIVNQYAENELEVNLESAIAQLNRYKMLQNNWTHHNSSVTISYGLEEVSEIINWLLDNWDNGFVGVSFMYRTDPTKTAEDMGFPYLPQMQVSKKEFEVYKSQLKPISLGQIDSITDFIDESCATGVCASR